MLIRLLFSLTRNFLVAFFSGGKQGTQNSLWRRHLYTRNTIVCVPCLLKKQKPPKWNRLVRKKKSPYPEGITGYPFCVAQKAKKQRYSQTCSGKSEATVLLFRTSMKLKAPWISIFYGKQKKISSVATRGDKIDLVSDRSSSPHRQPGTISAFPTRLLGVFRR